MAAITTTTTAVTTSASLPAIGDTIAGKYRLVRVIAEGGMGIVYEGVHRRLDQSVAIKILHPQYSTNQEILTRFDLEGRIASRLQGPNVARVHDIDSLPNGILYMVMELLIGHDLETELQRKGRLPIGEACDIVSQAAMGMREAHAMGVVHRDLKPANIFLCPVPDTKRYLAKVLDFGISRVTNDSGTKRVTTDFAMMGTALYMSPEQAKNAASVDQRSDVWSLGVILYELVTGRAPFEGQLTEVLVQVATAPITPPKQLSPDVPDELDRVIMRALDRDPSARHESMDALIADLTPFAPLEGVEILAQRLPRLPPPTVPEPERFSARITRGRAIVFAALALAFVIGVVLIGISIRTRTNNNNNNTGNAKALEDGFGALPPAAASAPAAEPQPSVAPTSIEIVETPTRPHPSSTSPHSRRPPKTPATTSDAPPRRL